MSRRTLERTSLAGFVAAVFALTYWRLFQGVDFTDESWYVGVAYRFAHRRQALRRRTQRSADHRGDPPLPAGVDLPRGRRTRRNRAVCPPRPLGRRGGRRVRGVGVASRLAGPTVAVVAGACAFTFVPFNIRVSAMTVSAAAYSPRDAVGLLALGRQRVRPWAGSAGARRVRLPAVDPCGRRRPAPLRLWLTRTACARKAAALSAPALGIPLVAFAVLGLLAGPLR